MPLSPRSACLALASASALALLPAAAADAARVSVKDTRVTRTSDLNFRAGRGEANRVRFDVKAKRVTVTDPRARIHTGRGCASLSAHRAVCSTTLDEFYFYNVKLGDRSDRATFRQRSRGELAIPVVDGGGGDDVIYAGHLKRYGILSGGDGDDRITGTDNSDSIRGGAGRDVLIGGRGDDQFAPDPSGAAMDDDKVVGGRGADEVSYAGRTTPVSVDLRRSSHQGSTGENDVFHSVEGAVGTAGDDTLLGNGAENDLQGIGGRDVIEGFGRDDRVWGGGGKKRDTEPDMIAGGDGNDVVLAQGGGTATGGAGDDELEGSGTLDGGEGDDVFEPTGGQVECGAGDDSVKVTHASPTALAGCERADLGRDQDLSIDLPLQRTETGIVVSSLSCADQEDPTRDSNLCVNELKVSLGEQLLASGTFDVSDSSTTLQMPYREGAREALGTEPKQVRVAVGRYSFLIEL